MDKFHEFLHYLLINYAYERIRYLKYFGRFIGMRLVLGLFAITIKRILANLDNTEQLQSKEEIIIRDQLSFGLFI